MKIETIEDLKEYIKKNYDSERKRQEVYEDSWEYAYDDGVEDGQNSMLYVIGEMTGMNMEELYKCI